MKVAYVFALPRSASYKLGQMILPQLEAGTHGDEGPGWIYYEPPEGFQPGEYTLEVWVNGEMFQRASLSIEREVANQ